MTEATNYGILLCRIEQNNFMRTNLQIKDWKLLSPIHLRLIQKIKIKQNSMFSNEENIFCNCFYFIFLE